MATDDMWLGLALGASLLVACAETNAEVPALAPVAPRSDVALAPGVSGPAGRPPAVSPASGPSCATDRAMDVEVYYFSRCQPCHGAQGRGDGPAAPALKPAPEAFSAEKAVTDEDLAKVILLGGPAVGMSAVMPASPDLQSDKDLLCGLVRHVRKLGH